MKRSELRTILSTFVSFTLVLAFSFPTAALATQPEVQVENHTLAGAQTVSQLSVDGVDAPMVGKALDDRAAVNTAEGVTWDIPVLWIGDDLLLATEAVEGHTYLPALAFFVPEEYTVEGGSFTVTFSESLTKVFGDEDVISVFDTRTGITYILPASLRSFFTPPSARTDVTKKEEANPAAGLGDGGNYPPLSNVEIWCAKTARDALTDDDLEWLIDLVLHTLEPQAVNLLIDSFPAFKAAAAQNQIGTQIGLYIYYKTGDKDGKYEHQTPNDVLAYVAGDPSMVNGELKYGYLIAIDVDDLLLTKDGEPVRNAQTGKFTLDRSGNGMITLNNTIVHEMFHAFMDDYNRTGMLGAKNVVDGYTPGGKFVSNDQFNLYNTLHYPYWFVEGSASAVEHVYQLRYAMFEMLRAKEGSCTEFEDWYTSDALLHNYLNAENSNKEPLYFDLENASNNQVDTNQSRYVTGYLAVLYLAELAAKSDPSIGSAVSEQKYFSSEKLHLGLDLILKRLHNGETLDTVIKDISTSEGTTMYNDAADFEKKFIKGIPVKSDTYYGNDASFQFTLDFLNYMRALEKVEGRDYKPNGSILFSFDDDYNIPLEEGKMAESDFFVIIASNQYVESTVPDSVAFASGGRSDPPNAPVAANLAAAAMAESDLPLAAKADAEPSLVGEPDALKCETAKELASEPVESNAEATPTVDPDSIEEQTAAPESDFADEGESEGEFGREDRPAFGQGEPHST